LFGKRNDQYLAATDKFYRKLVVVKGRDHEFVARASAAQLMPQPACNLLVQCFVALREVTLEQMTNHGQHQATLVDEMVASAAMRHFGFVLYPTH